MKHLRLAFAVGALGLLGAGLSSCLREPSYSTTPSISFASIDRIRLTKAGQQPVDSILISINFQDGDGDLGLTSAESQVAPYGPYPSIYVNNYFVEPYVKLSNGKFVSLVSTGRFLGGTGAYNGRFEHLSSTNDSKSAPLKGTLTRAVNFGYGDVFLPNEEVRFRVCIADRALHLSDTITTASIIIPTR